MVAHYIHLARTNKILLLSVLSLGDKGRGKVAQQGQSMSKVRDNAYRHY